MALDRRRVADAAPRQSDGLLNSDCDTAAASSSEMSATSSSSDSSQAMVGNGSSSDGMLWRSGSAIRALVAAESHQLENVDDSPSLRRFETFSRPSASEAGRTTGMESGRQRVLLFMVQLVCNEYADAHCTVMPKKLCAHGEGGEGENATRLVCSVQIPIWRSPGFSLQFAEKGEKVAPGLFHLGQLSGFTICEVAI